MFKWFLAILGIGAVIFCGYMAVTMTIRANNPDPTAREAFDQINLIRGEYKIPALVWDDHLAQLAKGRSQEMADTGVFEHKNLGYAECILRRDGGYAYPENVVDPWRKSSAHFHILSDPQYTRGAVGIVGDYATFLAD